MDMLSVENQERIS